MIDITKPLELADGTSVIFRTSSNPNEIVVDLPKGTSDRLDKGGTDTGRVFHLDGTHAYGKLPNLRNKVTTPMIDINLPLELSDGTALTNVDRSLHSTTFPYLADTDDRMGSIRFNDSGNTDADYEPQSANLTVRNVVTNKINLTDAYMTKDTKEPVRVLALDGPSIGCPIVGIIGPALRNFSADELVPYTKEVVLPKVPSKLLEIALADFIKAEKTDIKIDMNEWQTSCSVCFAGAVMAGTLNHMGAAVPANFPENENQLYALNNLRTGNIASAFGNLGQPKPDTLPDHLAVVGYENNPTFFKRQMHDLITLLSLSGC